MPGCRGAFGLTELGFLEEGLSHSLPFAGWKERGTRRTTAPSPLARARAAPRQPHTGQRSTRESWSIPEGWAAGEGVAVASLPADLCRRDSRTMSLPRRLAKRLTL